MFTNFHVMHTVLQYERCEIRAVYNTSIAIQNLNLPNMGTRKATKYVGMKRRSCRSNQTPHTGNTRNPPTFLSDTASDQSTQSGHLSHLHPHYRSRSQKTTTPFSVEWVGKLCSCVGTIQRIYLFSDDVCSDSTLILTTIAVKQC
jgi:hypothetical protein